jgi:hypothetical protein
MPISFRPESFKTNIINDFPDNGRWNQVSSGEGNMDRKGKKLSLDTVLLCVIIFAFAFIVWSGNIINKRDIASNRGRHRESRTDLIEKLKNRSERPTVNRRSDELFVSYLRAGWKSHFSHDKVFIIDSIDDLVDYLFPAHSGNENIESYQEIHYVNQYHLQHDDFARRNYPVYFFDTKYLVIVLLAAPYCDIRYHLREIESDGTMHFERHFTQGAGGMGLWSIFIDIPRTFRPEGFNVKVSPKYSRMR